MKDNFVLDHKKPAKVKILRGRFRCVQCGTLFEFHWYHGDAASKVLRCTNCGTWSLVQAPVECHSISEKDGKLAEWLLEGNGGIKS
jgi:DNA-directed RNA polymerase subunit RPC12/RpoP